MTNAQQMAWRLHGLLTAADLIAADAIERHTAEQGDAIPALYHLSWQAKLLAADLLDCVESLEAKAKR